jgi:hypothetical protein
MLFVASPKPFNGHVCFISQYAPFSNANYLQVINALEFIIQKYEITEPLTLNFFMGSSQYVNFKCSDCNFIIPIELRYEIMVNNAIELANKYNFIPSGLYHIADFDCNKEWVDTLIRRIGQGSIIISNDVNQIYNQIEKFAGDKYTHLVFQNEDFSERVHTNYIRKLLVVGETEHAKQFLPNKTVEIMQKHGLLDK